MKGNVKAGGENENENVPLPPHEEERKSTINSVQAKMKC